MAEYQRYVHQLEKMHGWLDVDLVHNGFLMTEEVGELFKAIRRYERLFPETSAKAAPEDEAAPPAREVAAVPEASAEQRQQREAARANAAEEIVDVLNYLLAIANRLDVDVEAAFRAKNARNQTRRWG